MDLMSILKDGFVTSRRVARRAPCRLIGGCLGKDKNPHLIRINNISKKGAKISTLYSLPQKTSFKMEVTSRSKGILFLEGKVRWGNRIKNIWHYGITFNQELPYSLEEIM